MPFIARPRWLLTINAAAVQPTAVSIVSEIGECLTTAADLEIDLTSGAAPGAKQAVDLRIADLDALVSWPVFAGYVQETIATSDPNRVVVRCQGELSKMRDTWDADADFTGDTDGEAIEAALTASDVAYTGAHIQDAGYVLGALVPIIGTKRTSRSTVVKELNRVLGMALVEIAGDVQRFAYDLVPDAANIVKTFIRGVDADFWGNERTRGAIDEIKNAWTVNGVGFPCDGAGDFDEDGSCRCQLFGKAEGSNAALGSGVRVEPSGEQSDVIQDEDIAAWVAERLMRWWNRVQDRITVQTGFDPEVTIGMTIGAQDSIAGVHLTAAAASTPYLVTRQEIKDHDATYQCTGGAAGDTGAVTSGVEKRCNKSIGSGSPILPGFTPPTIIGPIGPTPIAYDACTGVTVTADPPGGSYGTAQTVTLTASVDAAIYYTVDGSTPTTASARYTEPITIAVTTALKLLAQPTGTACTTDPDAQAYAISGGGGVCEDAVGPDDPSSDWFTDIGTAIAVVAGELDCNEGSTGYNDAIAIAWDDDWQLTAVVEGSIVGPGTPEIELGIVTDEFFGIGAQISMYDDGASIDITTFGDGAFPDSQPFDVQAPMIWILARLGAWVFWSITQGANHLAGSLLWGSPPETGTLAIRVLCNNGSMQMTSAQHCVGSGIGEPIAANWTALVGSWSFPGDTEAINGGTGDADAYAAGHVFDGTERCRWRGAVSFGATDETLFTFALDDSEGAATGDFCGFQVTIGATPAVDVSTFDGFQETLSLDLAGGDVFFFDADPGANVFRLTLQGLTHVYPLGTWPGPKTLHVQHGTGIAVDLDVTDMAIVGGG